MFKILIIGFIVLAIIITSVACIRIIILPKLYNEYVRLLTEHSKHFNLYSNLDQAVENRTVPVYSTDLCIVLNRLYTKEIDNDIGKTVNKISILHQILEPASKIFYGPDSINDIGTGKPNKIIEFDSERAHIVLFFYGAIVVIVAAVALFTNFGFFSDNNKVVPEEAIRVEERRSDSNIRESRQVEKLSTRHADVITKGEVIKRTCVEEALGEMSYTLKIQVTEPKEGKISIDSDKSTFESNQLGDTIEVHIYYNEKVDAAGNVVSIEVTSIN